MPNQVQMVEAVVTEKRNVPVFTERDVVHVLHVLRNRMQYRTTSDIKIVEDYIRRVMFKGEVYS